MKCKNNVNIFHFQKKKEEYFLFFVRLLVNQLCAIACEDATNIEETPILPFNSVEDYQCRPNTLTKDYIRSPQ